MGRVAVGLVLALVGGCALAHEADAPSVLDAGVRERLDAFVADDAFLGSDAFVSPDAPEPTRSGYIVVGQDLPTAMNPTPYLYLAAYFGDFAPADLRRGHFLPGCTVLDTEGACVVMDCPLASSSDLAGTVSASVPPDIRLSSSMLIRNGGALAYDFYFADHQNAPLFMGGEVAISVSGATVPAFTAVVTTPPPSTAPAPTTFSRSVDTVATWPATTADQISMNVSAADGTTTWSIQCTAPAPARSITVPARLIARFAEGALVSTDATTAGVTYEVVGGYLVQLLGFQSTWNLSATVVP